LPKNKAKKPPPPPLGARQLAHKALLRVECDGAYSGLALDTILKRAQVEARERRFCTELFYGTLRNHTYLNFLLAAFCDRGLKKLPEVVLCALRLAAYELVYLQTPSRAAVNEGVRLLRRQPQRLRGFCNAVLRKVAVASEAGKLPQVRDFAKSDVAALAIRYSQPEWLLEEIAARRGVQSCAAWAKANNEAAPVSLRVNKCRTTREELAGRIRGKGREAGEMLSAGKMPAVQVNGTEKPGQVELPKEFPDNIYVAGVGAVPKLPGSEEGEFCAQDPAATLVGRLANPQPSELVVDLCAAPGGKSTHLAEIMGDDGKVAALELHPGRTRLIGELAERLNLASVKGAAVDCTNVVAVRDAVKRVSGEDSGPPSLVVLDAPCSGLGTSRRNPEIARRKRGSQGELMALQDTLLDVAAELLTEAGGVLVYSVCTPTASEGVERIAAFLGRHPAFVVDSMPAELLAFSQAATGVLAGSRYLQTWTDLHGCDSFFAIRLRRS